MPGSIPYKKLLIGELSWARFVRSILLIYGLFAVYVYFRADSMIFLPQPNTYQDHDSILKLSVNESEQISAMYLTNPNAQYTLLYIHGNAEDLGEIAPQLKRFQQWGYSVFAYDYRGYGTSDGKPGEQNAYEDAEVAYRYMTEQLKIPRDRIIVYGRSVGGGSAVELAARHSVAGLSLESTFTSAFRVVVPFPILPFDKFRNLHKLKQVDCPVLVMHGQADQIIPFNHGQDLYKAVKGPKVSLWEPEAGHNDFSWVAGARHENAIQQLVSLIAERGQQE